MDFAQELWYELQSSYWGMLGLFFFLLFPTPTIFPYSYSGFQFEAIYWSQILAQMLTPNSTPEVATAKTTCG